ncbi:MAG: MATE family efflux transporter [Proteobacteria bacterium]|nr:MATE family efflux transporter [Pseudomonadota bacterium]MDA0993011.1 MATE family efflux transporter [Pseudomonadota bacterium]
MAINLQVSPDRRTRILSLALPIIGGMVSQNLLNIVDTAMVGFLGDPALAAVGLGGFVVFMCQALILGISTGVQSSAARRKGEGRPDRAAATLNTALLVVLVIAPLMSIVLIQLAEVAYPFLNKDPDVIVLGVPYIEWRLGAIVFVGMNFAFRGYWNALDMSRVYMNTLVIMHACNIVLNYGLIFGNFGLPAYGVTGAGMASAISMGIGTATYFFLGFRHAAKDGFLKSLATRAEAVSLIRISLPAGLQQLFFAAGLVAMFYIIGRIGTPELAAANVLITVLLFAILPGLALGIACTTLVGQALGRKNADDAYQWTWDVAKVTVILLSVLGLPMWIVPDLVSSIFIHEPATRDLARWPMRVMGLTMPIEALSFAFMHGLLGAGDARRVMLVSIGTQWLVFLPLAYLVGPFLGFGLLGVWILQGGSRALNSFLFIEMWRGRKWQHISV